MLLSSLKNAGDIGKDLEVQAGLLGGSGKKTFEKKERVEDVEVSEISKGFLWLMTCELIMRMMGGMVRRVRRREENQGEDEGQEDKS
jgi:hypothetical protein